MLWQIPQNFPVIQANQVHIWRILLKCNQNRLTALTNLLNTQEQTRASGFMAEHARNNFIIARGVLRKLLAKYLHIPPQDLLFQQNQYGKIHLDSSALQFNISHSHDWALFAFVLDYPIGIDIERIHEDTDFIAIAKRFFSKQETKTLLALPQTQQLHAFFNCWSRKEAFIKATGKGIFFALDEFSVEISNKTSGLLQLQIPTIEPHQNNWSLEALNPTAGYTGAFATSCPKYQTNFYDMKLSW